MENPRPIGVDGAEQRLVGRLKISLSEIRNTKISTMVFRKLRSEVICNATAAALWFRSHWVFGAKRNKRVYDERVARTRGSLVLCSFAIKEHFAAHVAPCFANCASRR